MYDGIKQALGPIQKKSAPLKSATGVLIQDRVQQMERWVQHYSELYSRENVVTEEALNNKGTLFMAQREWITGGNL